MASTISAHQILDLLATKHHEDIFIPECKDGSTWFSNHLRLDAWVMNRSWKKMTFTGYEIKVSRSDFLKDQKMHLYLDLCNQIYVVAPKGMISPDELHPEIGLMSPSTNGTKLFIIKKAPYREIKPPTDLLLYIIMCRTKITKEWHQDKRDYWRQWLEDKKIDHNLGYSVSQSLQKTIKDRIEQVENENRMLKRRIEAWDRKWDEITAILAPMGIDSKESAWHITKKLDDIKKTLAGAIDPQVEINIQNAQRSLEVLLTNIETIRGEVQ